MKLIICLLIIFFIGFNESYGETISGKPNEVFRSLSKKDLEKLLNQNIVKIGDMNLIKLSKELETVEWRTFDLGFLGGSGGKRMTSIYIVKDKMVVINTLSLQSLVGKPIKMFSWALHEALGALGYDDENYELSSSISFLANNPSHLNSTGVDYVQSHFLELKKSSTGRVYTLNGGSTVVGGGGDAIIIDLKQRLLSRYFEWVKKNHPYKTAAHIKKGFLFLTKLKMETYLETNADYNNSSFWLEGETFYLGAGAQFVLDKIQKDENLDSMLDLLQDHL